MKFTYTNEPLKKQVRELHETFNAFAMIREHLKKRKENMH